MIHYTLLPEKEMRILRREYRIRVFIVLIFFISCAIFIGMGFMVPSFILSYTQEKESIRKIELMQKDREVSGIDNILGELSKSGELLKKLKEDADPVVFSDIIRSIINYKSTLISIQAIQITKNKEASSTIEMIVQGKAPTRELVLDFKKKLDQDSRIIKVELPISDLAKSKDLVFSMRITLKTPNED
jgi:hypothetical protein